MAVNAALVAVPLTARAPDHPPLAVHAVALADDHVNTTVFPESTDEGDALNVIVGSGRTVTVADCVALPPAPVQIKVYVAFAVNAGVVNVPLTVCAPLHAPLAVQEVALLLLQFKVAVDP